jgi:hypothetical protein
LTVVLACVLLSARPGAAATIISVSNVTNVPVGSTGNTLEVDLTNTGPSAVEIGAFSFEIAVTQATFQQADVMTANPYIFAGDSLFGPIISTSAPGPVLDASDVFDVIDSGVTLGPGTTVGLGRVFFDVSPSATPGSVLPVLLQGSDIQTSLADFAGNDVAITTLNDGSITLSSGGTAAVPEPSKWALLGMAAATLAGWQWRRRGRS